VFNGISCILDDLAPACLLTQEWGTHEYGFSLRHLCQALERLGVTVPDYDPVDPKPAPPAIRRTYRACINGPYVTFVHHDYEVMSHQLDEVDPGYQRWRRAQVVRIKSTTEPAQTYRLVNIHAVSGKTTAYGANHQLKDRCRRQIFYAVSRLLAGETVAGNVPARKEDMQHFSQIVTKEFGVADFSQIVTKEFGVAAGDFNTKPELQKSWAPALDFSVHATKLQLLDSD